MGRYTYTTDLRFEAFHSPHTDDWIVRLKNPRPSDSGFYGCQISTTPHRTQLIYLTVHGRFFPYLFFYATIKLRKVQFLAHFPPPQNISMGISLPTHRWMDFTFEKPMTFRLWSMDVRFLQPNIAFKWYTRPCMVGFFPILLFNATIKLQKVKFLIHLPPQKIFLWEFHSPHTDEWILHLKNPWPSDFGFYGWVSNFYNPTSHSTYIFFFITTLSNFY